MTAAAHAEALPTLAVFRSSRDPERRAQQPRRDSHGHQDPWPPALQLVGHMAVTAFVFTSFMTLVWLSSVGFSFLHSIHPFPDDMYELFEALKRALILIDAALSGVVLLRGLWQYLSTLSEADHDSGNSPRAAGGSEERAPHVRPADPGAHRSRKKPGYTLARLINDGRSARIARETSLGVTINLSAPPQPRSGSLSLKRITP